MLTCLIACQISLGRTSCRHQQMHACTSCYLYMCCAEVRGAIRLVCASCEKRWNKESRKRSDSLEHQGSAWHDSFERGSPVHQPSQKRLGARASALTNNGGDLQ